jgi:hypothetical protein
MNNNDIIHRVVFRGGAGANPPPEPTKKRFSCRFGAKNREASHGCRKEVTQFFCFKSEWGQPLLRVVMSHVL